MERAWDSVANAEAILGKLRGKQAEVSMRSEHLKEPIQRQNRVRSSETRQSSPGLSISSMQIQALLPRLELPKFSGRRQQWDAFWAVFKTNIDEQPISKMMKYSYLVQSLTGEARQVASRFQLIEENYELVIQALKNKYGRDSSIVEDLLAQLESCKAEGTTTAQQLSLLDQLSAILTQLSNKGQERNHRMILNTVLRNSTLTFSRKR